MKALVIDRLGGPEVYRMAELPVPHPGEGEVLVRVDGTSLNPVDYKIREGKFPPATPKTFPAATLRDFSGRIVRAGSGVSRWTGGDRVYGITDTGASAEYTIVKPSALGTSPANLDPVEAATVPLAGMTAWQALFDHGDLQPGERVLIHAGAGGVGTFAIQLAKWKGAYVIATAAKENHAFLRSLGADELVDYRNQRFEDVLDKVHLVLHSIGQEQIPASQSVVQDGGRLVSILGQPDEELAERRGIRAIHFTMQPQPVQLERLAHLVAEGAIRPIINRRVMLDQVPDAMHNLEQGHMVGKVAVDVAGYIAQSARQESTTYMA